MVFYISEDFIVMCPMGSAVMFINGRHFEAVIQIISWGIDYGFSSITKENTEVRKVIA